MTYQWDGDKAAAHLRKHDVDFADAVAVFSDDLAITISDERFDEERLITIGMDAFARVLVVVYTWSRDEIRLFLLSKRRAVSESNMRRNKQWKMSMILARASGEQSNQCRQECRQGRLALPSG